MLWLTRGQPEARAAEGRSEGRLQESLEGEEPRESEGGRERWPGESREDEGGREEGPEETRVGGRGALRNLGRVRERGSP